MGRAEVIVLLIKDAIQSIAEKAEKDEMLITDVQRSVKKSYSAGTV